MSSNRIDNYGLFIITYIHPNLKLISNVPQSALRNVINMYQY